MQMIYDQFSTLLTSKNITRCNPSANVQRKRLLCLLDESIDFLFIDGTTSRKGSLEDVEHYLPKVKPGGYIWLNHADVVSKDLSVAFLMKQCKWIKEKSVGVSCVLFQKPL